MGMEQYRTAFQVVSTLFIALPLGLAFPLQVML
eukprot:COSAG02_NODE_61104_length_269_cov_0.911765_2_plen_32_part_01